MKKKLNKLALKVEQLTAGHVALCPHKNTALFGGLCPDEVWLKGDLEMLKRCDELVLAAGWEGSSGTQTEIELARKLRMPVYETIEDWERVLI